MQLDFFLRSRNGSTEHLSSTLDRGNSLSRGFPWLRRTGHVVKPKKARTDNATRRHTHTYTHIHARTHKAPDRGTKRTSGTRGVCASTANFTQQASSTISRPPVFVAPTCVSWSAISLSLIYLCLSFRLFSSSHLHPCIVSFYRRVFSDIFHLSSLAPPLFSIFLAPLSLIASWCLMTWCSQSTSLTRGSAVFLHFSTIAIYFHLI